MSKPLFTVPHSARFWGLMAVAAGLSFSGVSAADVLTVPGSACTAINPAQSQQMEWRDYGVINRDPSRALFVTCPVTRNRGDFTDDQSRLGAAALVFNADDPGLPAKEISCRFKEFVGGNAVRGRTENMDVASMQQASMVISDWVINDSELSHFQFTCKLPPLTGVSALLTEMHGAEGSTIERELLEAGL